MSEKPQKNKGVDSVERALKILDCFDTGSPELTLKEIAQRTGFYKSTILRLSVSLERFAYLVRSENGCFRLGPSAWRIGANYRRSFQLADIMRPELKWLSDTTQETASYYIREGGSRICLFRNEPKRSIRHTINEGASMPIDRGASGKIFLAFTQNQDKNSNSPSSTATRIRQQGYAVSHGERDPEVAAIAVPLQSRSGQLMGALCVSGLITRFNEERQAELLDALLQTRERLMSQMSA